MEKTIVVGIGNKLMMDDGVGIYVVEELAEKNEDSQVQYMIGESDVDYCLSKIQGATKVIIVDAVYNNKRVGEVSVIPIKELSEQKSLDISPHNTHLFHALYQHELISGYLLAVEPFSIQFQIGLSNELKKLWTQIQTDVENKITELLIDPKSV
ncbi:hydrogenase maturation protease [Halalkalibacillus sediminis]|uniref:Hydrogenase maturation protease n=1 Tax=Halalkalibacillus sediminis TaxID=2018042 RepID=A0A2I0QQP2_9BACI|nr:hydrogenase maturation protease [Halalkalibacillus sediminis]PKR76655.1 hydrogenase maturation protease [Halalkalibacillus sediminis]